MELNQQHEAPFFHSNLKHLKFLLFSGTFWKSHRWQARRNTIPISGTRRLLTEASGKSSNLYQNHGGEISIFMGILVNNLLLHLIFMGILPNNLLLH